MYFNKNVENGNKDKWIKKWQITKRIHDIRPQHLLTTPTDIFNLKLSTLSALFLVP